MSITLDGLNPGPIMTVEIDLKALMGTYIKVDMPPVDIDPDYWDRQINARDRLNLTCLPSKLATLLFPDMPYAEERLEALKKEFPGLVERIHQVARRKGALIARSELEA